MVKSNNQSISAKAAPPNKSSRRTFLGWLWVTLGFMALVELIAVGIAFFRRSRSGQAMDKADYRISCGAVDQYSPGSVTAFVAGRFYLARLADGGFLAISRQCTHLGCTVPWVEKEMRFACPCHASAFDITGAVVNAPATRALDIYPLSIENQIIFVETGNPLRRNGFDKEQVTYPKLS